METAIKKAIEGGYSKPPFYGERFIQRMSERSILLDPLFWQCLGKSLGWRLFDAHEIRGNNLRCHLCGARYDAIGDCLKNPIRSWLIHWHRFIDHLASGGTPDDFFKELLANGEK